MRVGAHIQPLPRQELARAHLVEEDEGADHLLLARRQGAADLEAAHIMGAGNDDVLDHRCVGHWPPPAGGPFGVKVSPP
jgi:hypothetical protein